MLQPQKVNWNRIDLEKKSSKEYQRSYERWSHCIGRLNSRRQSGNKIATSGRRACDQHVGKINVPKRVPRWVHTDQTMRDGGLTQSVIFKSENDLFIPNSPGIVSRKGSPETVSAKKAVSR